MPLGRSDRGHAIAQLVYEHSNVLRVVHRHHDEMDAARLEMSIGRNWDPGSAWKRDPSPALGQACPGSEQEGPARVAQCPHERRSGARGRCLFAHRASRGGTQARCLNRQLSLPVSMISQ